MPDQAPDTTQEGTVQAQDEGHLEQEPQVPEKPEWLSDRYSSVEEQAKAYSELEKKLGEQSNEVGALRSENQELQKQLTQLIEIMNSSQQQVSQQIQNTETLPKSVDLLDVMSDPDKLASYVNDCVTNAVSKAVSEKDQILQALVNKTLSHEDMLEEQRILADPSYSKLYADNRDAVNRLVKEKSEQGLAIDRLSALRIVLGDKYLEQARNPQQPNLNPENRQAASGVTGVPTNQPENTPDPAEQFFNMWKQTIFKEENPNGRYFKHRPPIRGT